MTRTRAVLAMLVAALLAVAAGAATAADAQEVDPRYLLVDSRGRMISNEDFPGRFQLVSFGYTFCPDVCPTTLAAMAQILRHLGERAGRLQPIFISVDPERDTREVLAKYTAYFDPRIIGLTGSPEFVRAAADHYKVVYRKYLAPGAPPDTYSIDHSAGMYLLGPKGTLITKFAHNDSPRETAARIAGIMAAEPAAK
jgi:protein SCO1/2